MVCTSAAVNTDPGSTEQKSAILSLISFDSCRSVRQRRMSGWMPISRSFIIECCVGLVFISYLYVRIPIVMRRLGVGVSDVFFGVILDVLKRSHRPQVHFNERVLILMCGLNAAVREQRTNSRRRGILAERRDHTAGD